MYWLYILKHELHSEGYTLAISVSPTEQGEDGAELQIANYKSWDELSEVLSRAGIAPKILKSTKAALESDGWNTLRDLTLSPEQLRIIGFSGLS